MEGACLGRLDPTRSVMAMLAEHGPDGGPAVSVAQARAYAAAFARRASENFVVLGRLLPADLVEDFAAVYAFCRWADDLADEPDPSLGPNPSLERVRERSLELLAWFRGQLRLERPEHPVLVALRPTIERHRLGIAEFEKLLDAFELDQRLAVYERWAQLLDYCRLSAQPVGRIVLMMAGLRPPEEEPANRPAWDRSDAICTALQLTNHVQDLRRDLLDRGRVYLPREVTGFGPDELNAWVHQPHDRSARLACAQGVRAVVERTWGVLRARPGASRTGRGKARRAGGDDGDGRSGHPHARRTHRLHNALEAPDRRLVRAAVDRSARPGLAIFRSVAGDEANIERFGALIEGARPTTLHASQALCRDVTRRAGSSFAIGILLTPRRSRPAMHAVYAWMRLADDVADAPWPIERRRSLLDRFESQTERALAGRPAEGGPWPALVWAMERHELEPAWFRGLLAGVRQDLEPTPLATLGDLHTYCDRVAGNVGRCCVAIWGLRPGWNRDEALDLAGRRGRALQLVNIARDLQADARVGRRYVPDEVLAELDAGPTDRRVRAWLVERALREIDRTSPLEAAVRPQARPALWAMTRAYLVLGRRLLAEGARDGRVASAQADRLSLGLRAKAAIALGAVGRGLLGIGWRA
ncbi:MAG: hypothetical protein KatS3mg103_0127 [Phycisphaerales bacterium]|nr:MAG: hypothetical protein KatS3mg103_0127 [Phycisphaerales bacterium]